MGKGKVWRKKGTARDPRPSPHLGKMGELVLWPGRVWLPWKQVHLSSLVMWPVAAAPELGGVFQGQKGQSSWLAESLAHPELKRTRVSRTEGQNVPKNQQEVKMAPLQAGNHRGKYPVSGEVYGLSSSGSHQMRIEYMYNFRLLICPINFAALKWEVHVWNRLM